VEAGCKEQQDFFSQALFWARAYRGFVALPFSGFQPDPHPKRRFFYAKKWKK